MKKSFILFAVSLLMLACGTQNNKTQEKDTEEIIENIDDSKLETIEIAVIGMTCSGCERTVNTAVGNLPGVQWVKASHTDSTALVSFDPRKTNFDEMKAAITGKGYEVKDFSAVGESH